MESRKSYEKLKAFMEDVNTGKSKYVSLIDMGSSLRFCGHCGASCALRRCAACFRVYYCSKTCQRANWRQHKAFCRQQQPSRDSASGAASCGLSYQAASAGDASSNADSGTQTPSGVSVAAEGDAKPEACRACHETGGPMKRCGRCGAVTYCSKACQRQDWPSHKTACRKAARAATHRPTDGNVQEGRMFEDFARTLGAELPDHLLLPRATLTWPQAVEEAHRRYPGKKLLTRIKEVTHEYDLNVVEMASSVLLLRLARQHQYLYRHGWYLEDTQGEEIAVFFYLQQDSPEPYFSWYQLTSGNFFCLEHAYIHVFLDGHVGIRVDDNCDVSIIAA